MSFMDPFIWIAGLLGVVAAFLVARIISRKIVASEKPAQLKFPVRPYGIPLPPPPPKTCKSGRCGCRKSVTTSSKSIDEPEVDLLTGILLANALIPDEVVHHHAPESVSTPEPVAEVDSGSDFSSLDTGDVGGCDIGDCGGD